MGGQVEDAGGRQVQQPLLGGLRAQEELGLGKQALDGLGLLAGAWQWDGCPGSVRRVLAQRGEEALEGGGALGLR